ncbi:hypothetical protein ACIP6X_02345 [Streptomyces coeruleorubidus]|uniref:hypothetical protein n=1 Tax=Streptomyces coeruleorubidus TaxID=116188 RepID=UPI0037FFE739
MGLFKKDPASTARLANAITEAARKQDSEEFKETESELRKVHGRDAMAAAYERISGSTVKPPATWS